VGGGYRVGWLTKNNETKPVPPVPSRDDKAWDRFFEEVVVAEKGKPTTPPRAGLAAAPVPRRSWLARTFVAPVERLLAAVARLVVTVAAIVVSGGVLIFALSRLPSGQTEPATVPYASLQPSTTVTAAPIASEPTMRADLLTSPTGSETINTVAVSAIEPENTRNRASPPVIPVVTRPVATAAAAQMPPATTFKPVETVKKSPSKPVQKSEPSRPGYTWVNGHTRDGKTVEGYWRKLPRKK